MSYGKIYETTWWGNPVDGGWGNVYYDLANPYLLNKFGGAAAAYSLRQLSSDTTNVVRVRRDSDNAEQDFTAAEITDGTLDAFVGSGNNGFVTTWYDQSGNSNDATQTSASAQPKIYDSSTGVILENGKPALDYGTLNGNVGLEVQSIKDLPLNSFSWFLVRNTQTVPTSTPSLTFSGNDDVAFFPYIIADGIGSRIFWRNLGSATEVNSGDISNQQFTFGFDYSLTSNNYKVYRNNDEVVNVNTSGTAGSFNTFYLGSQGSVYYGGLMQEFIAYPVDQSSNRENIEQNINNHYNIY